jgi:lipoprotein-anchoring transpeptidase ErfK/SrfK
VPLAVSLLVAAVVTLDPHPFDSPSDPPTLALASEPLITGATATTIPPTVTIPPRDASVVPSDLPTVSTTEPAPAPTAAPAVAQPTATPPTTARPAPSPPATVARFVANIVPVYRAEGDSSPAFSLYSTTELGSPRVMLTTAVHGDWIEILLPLRPNGAVGWVRAADVQLSTVADRIDVDRGTRSLTWTRAGAVVMQIPAGIGSPSTPTPAGTFFVTDVISSDTAEGRGRWVVALNGHSDAYTTFEGGDARIAIHGTSDPSSIGNAVSNGCVRIADSPLDELRSAIPLGTPVVVH